MFSTTTWNFCAKAPLVVSSACLITIILKLAPQLQYINAVLYTLLHLSFQHSHPLFLQTTLTLPTSHMNNLA